MPQVGIVPQIRRGDGQAELVDLVADDVTQGASGCPCFFMFPPNTFKLQSRILVDFPLNFFHILCVEFWHCIILSRSLFKSVVRPITFTVMCCSNSSSVIQSAARTSKDDEVTPPDN